MKRYDLFLTETGSCWKFSENGDWTNITNQFKIMNDEFESANFNIVDIVSNGDEVHLELLNTGLYSNIFRFNLTVITSSACVIQQNERLRRKSFGMSECMNEGTREILTIMFRFAQDLGIQKNLRNTCF